MPQTASIRRQRYDVIVTEISKSKDFVWKLLGSRSTLAGVAYNHLADAQELGRALGTDLFVEDDLPAGAERCRRIMEALNEARGALEGLAEEQQTDVEKPLQQIQLAVALLVKLAEDISPEDTFEDEDR